MYLQKLFSKPRANFVYGLGYDEKTYSLVFTINEKLADYLNKKLHPQNLYLRYAQERLIAGDVEQDILKNFGFGNISKNRGVKDGLIELSFPVGLGVKILNEICTICDGTGMRGGYTCPFCHGTKKEIERNISLRTVLTSFYLLVKYLNIVMTQDETGPYKDFGFQHIYFEIEVPDDGRTIGLGGNISDEFIEAIKNSEPDSKCIEDAMYECMLAIEGYIQHPEWEVYKPRYEYRCKINDEGGFYLEVPGVNSCSFYTSNSGIGENPLGCHNIDTPWQALLLIVGFGKLCSLINFNGRIVV